MKAVKFNVNGLTYIVKATSLHTALHRLGEQLEQQGYTLSTIGAMRHNTLSIVMRNKEIENVNNEEVRK